MRSLQDDRDVFEGRVRPIQVIVNLLSSLKLGQSNFTLLFVKLDSIYPWWRSRKVCNILSACMVVLVASFVILAYNHESVSWVFGCDCI